MAVCKEVVPGKGLPEIPTCRAILDPDGDPIICAVLFEEPCFLGHLGARIEEKRYIPTEGNRKRIKIRQMPVLAEVVE
ncbi:MAG: hypothetical protein ABII80_04015 [bacterium]